MDDTRQLSQWPRCGASAAIFRDREVLLVQRGKGALAGYWSLPGGHIEAGEKAIAAALRETREETGVDAALCGLLDIHEVLLGGGDLPLSAHYVIAVFYGRWLSGAPQAGGDARDARFVPIGEVEGLCLTDGASLLIPRAWAALENCRE
jgi:8-oxo-dGTP diphosphatase